MKERPYTGFYARFLGGFSLSYQGKELPIPANPQTKTMQILLILLKAGQQGVERKTLLEVLQGEGGDRERGMNNFRQRVYLLRKIMERAHFPEGKYIVQKNGQYYFSLEYELTSDTALLDELIAQMRNRPKTEEKQRLEWEYCQNYQGEFLPMLGGEAWAAEEEAHYQKWYFNSLSDLCARLKEQGEYEKLLELCTMASRIHPYDEWQTVQIDCLMALNRYHEAMKVYEEASDIFYEDLGIGTLEKTVARYRNREGQMYFLANAMTGIKDVLMENEERQGAYCCSYPSFLDAYRVLARMEDRSGIPSTLMVCTMNEGKGAQAGQLEEKMEGFRQVLAGEIRSGDVYTRYSSRQFLVLLINAEEKDGKKIADRLNRKWTETGESHGWTMEFLIQRTEGPGEEERGNGKERYICGTHHQPGERYLAGAGYLA
mgnify:FL=1